jgi:hypothetical protein
MKTNYIIFLIAIVLGCKPNQKEKVKEPPCEVKNLEDESGLGLFSDFTISEVEQVEKDTEGTEWKYPTKDDYRFVLPIDYSEYGSILLVYKNKKLLEKYVGLKCKSKRNVPRDLTKCDLDWSKEHVSISWYDTTNSVRIAKKGKTIFDPIFEVKAPNKILQFEMFREIGSCYVYYQLNKNTKIEGSFTFGQQNRQERK